MRMKIKTSANIKLAWLVHCQAQWLTYVWQQQESDLKNKIKTNKKMHLNKK